MILVAFIVCAFPSFCQTRSFVIDKDKKCFLRDNETFQYISGSIHYFRVPRTYWKDRLQKIRMAGLNTIATYVEWSGHEPQRGKYNFLGDYDVVEFCKEAQRQGLLVIIRVGPYICGERDNGGLPFWIFNKTEPDKLRTTDKTYMDTVETWLDHLLPKIKPLFYANGGPVIALQVENEYGHLMCDSDYMAGIYNIFKKHVADDVILFTNDYWSVKYTKCGRVPGAPEAANMYTADSVKDVIAAMNSANPQGSPVFLMELYVSWFHRWGYKRYLANPPEFLNTFKELLRHNASVNLYMFHGGTNFGFSAPSRAKVPLITSYDYDAPLSEAGDPMDLYSQIRDVIKEFARLPAGNVPVSSSKLNIGAVKLTEGASLIEVMGHFRANEWLKTFTQPDPMTFNDVGQDYGFIMYTVNAGTVSDSTLVVSGIKDRAYVVTNHSIAVLDSGNGTTTITVEKGENLTIIIENLGREFYKLREGDPKGITGSVTLDGNPLKNWTMEAVPVVENRDVSLVMQFLENKTSAAIPGFFHGTFTVPKWQVPVRDTFLDPTGWTTGFAFINGINLGRYWPKTGPQVTLYLPGAFLLPHPEENRLFLLEMEGAPEDRTVKLASKHVLDAPVRHGSIHFWCHPLSNKSENYRALTGSNRNARKADNQRIEHVKVLKVEHSLYRVSQLTCTKI